MKSIREEHIHVAFVQMLNKLGAGKDIMLKPFVDSLRGENNKNRLRKIIELDERMKKLREQEQVLAKILNSGYVELDVFYAEDNNILGELAELEKEKSSLSAIVSGDLTNLSEAQKLLKFVNKNDGIKKFADEDFLEFVDTIMVCDRQSFTFNLKCGLKLTEEVKLQ